MSRINTNVSSLVAQKTLNRSNVSLQESLTRLSTGLRINSGKDDPAGLIASENLRRDIASLNKAITNSERANQLIGTADSALGQISNLLNDIRGLVVEAANTGVLSDEQVAANQLQVDSSLEAIDRISQVTTFQGRKLLDGTLDFQLSYTAGAAAVSDLNIDQANLGAAGSVAVDITISAAATQALITNATGFDPSAAAQAEGILEGVTAGTIEVTAAAGGAADGIVGNSTDFIYQAATDITQASRVAYALTGGGLTVTALAGGDAEGAIGNGTDLVLQAAAGITQSTNTFNLTNGDFDITTVANTAASGAVGNTLTLDIQWSAAATSANYNAGTNTLTVVANNGGATTIDDIVNAIDGLAEFATSNVVNGTNLVAAGDDQTINNALAGGNNGTNIGATYNAGTNVITVNVGAQTTIAQVAAAIAGVNGGLDFTASASSGGTTRFNTADFTTASNFLTTVAGSDGTTTAAYVGNQVTVNVALNATVGQVATAINGLAAFNATATVGSGNAFDTGDFGTELAPLSGGVAAGVNDVLGADLVVKIAGSRGAEVFTFEANATITQLVNAVNLVSDATGVAAADNGGTLELRSTGYGTDAVVDVEVLEEGVGGGFEAGLSAVRDTGTDIVASVNGVTANGKGNTLSINTTTLDLSLTVTDGSSTDISFTIGGGGAVFQLGPQVVSNQQARIGIGSVNTAELGGSDGQLYQLRSGNDADLLTDPNTGTLIVDAAINKVTTLRGRLGAFQRTTLETNIASLNDTVTNLVDAESSIRDADFAAETARLTRAQILVQSGTQVLAIANQNPQNVLALLRG